MNPEILVEGPSVRASKPLGVPMFFYASCIEAARGGKRTYGNAGWALASGLWTGCPIDVENDEWIERVHALVALLEAEDDDGTCLWFHENLPRCMRIVPKRRTQAFMRGVRAAFEDGRLDN